MTSLTVTIGLPPKQVHSNFRSRSHWPRTKALKAYRKEAWAFALDAWVIRRPFSLYMQTPKWPKVRITATFHRKDGRGVMDQDNAIHALKAAVDGLCDAGIIANDRGVEWAPVVQLIDKVRPRVELLIEEVA